VQDNWVEEQVNKQAAQWFAPYHISSLKSISIKLTNPVRNSEETLRFRYKPNRVMLFRETVAVYSDNHTEHRHCVSKTQFSF
jgi:hypothetical protein